MANYNKVKNILEGLVALPNCPDITPQVVREFHVVLSQWPDDLLEMAVLNYKSTETFFPTPGAINARVLDLQMIAMNIPTAGEAWSQVLNAIQHKSSIWCETGAALREQIPGKTGSAWRDAQNNYERHLDACTICKPCSGFSETYSHPAVAETVRLLGGRDALMTDNPAADRKQFIDAYRERITIEGRRSILPAEVQSFIEDNQAGQMMKRLVGGLSK